MLVSPRPICINTLSIYKSRKGDRLISPKEQEAIRNVFRSAEIAYDPKFYQYQYSLAWL
ncbi:DUF6078 family protein [Bacteroides fluxus]|jgi:hypothetical protein|uniref:Conserved domain protein n=1 Tax=Bacteroides fluxus YIT 12057 TaxID=763034 RepID=F3PYE3_9BACE|nr:conserved domain protein [Bacteroides fluxus YIT 12057]